jgi:hypothetical protein
MHGDRGNVQLASKRALVQRLNVFQSMFEPVPAQVDFILGHRIKHERVIRIWGMPQGEDVGVIVRHLFLSPHRLDRIYSLWRNKAPGCLAIKQRRNLEDGAPATPNEYPSARAWAEARGVRPSISQKQNSRRDFARRLFETFYKRPVNSLIGSPPLEASA